MRLEYSDRAKQDLKDAITALAADTGKDFARQHFQKIREAVEALLTTFPESGSEYELKPPYRRVISGTYYFFYRVAGDVLTIGHVRHSHMQDWR